MIDWLQEDEGVFKSHFFKNDENNQDLFVYVNLELEAHTECAEQCVAAFNSLSHSAIHEICRKIIDYVKEEGFEEEFEFPESENPLDILNSCWFIALYVDMAEKDDEIAYAVEGEGDWGELFGFVIRNNRVVYVGADYLNHIKNPW